jgi:hypothetical protein
VVDLVGWLIRHCGPSSQDSLRGGASNDDRPASVDEADLFDILLVRVSAPHHAFPQES